MQSDLHDDQRVKPRPNIIYYDAESLRKVLKLTHRRRFHNIESSEKYKAEQQRFPRDRHRNQGDELTCNLVDHDKLRVFQASGASHSSSCWNAH